MLSFDICKIHAGSPSLIIIFIVPDSKSPLEKRHKNNIDSKINHSFVCMGSYKSWH